MERREILSPKVIDDGMVPPDSAEIKDEEPKEETTPRKEKMKADEQKTIEKLIVSVEKAKTIQELTNVFDTAKSLVETFTPESKASFMKALEKREVELKEQEEEAKQDEGTFYDDKI